MARRIIKYNPSFLSQEELIHNFVVRGSDLEMITRIIRDNTTDSNQHLLIIGPRGCGKTTLVLRVAAEIEKDPELGERWYPLAFSEESYEVVSAAEFWLEALFHLAEKTGEEKRKRTYAELKNEMDDQRLGERALAQLLDFADSQGKRLLLIVENLNMLFTDLLSRDEAWKMRHTLLNEPRIMLLATATSRFEGIDNASQAMYEMFKIHELKRLNTEECNTVWELITGAKLQGEKIRPIEILTGGNPRLLTIFAGFSSHRSFGRLLEDLVDLIDDHTEYFKSHLDNLPPIERKAYLALAELWDPSTARDIARAARLDVNKTSSLLNRLVGRGAVVVARHEKKTKWYMVAERMYNIYYLLRRRGKPADRVRAAVKFMISMYDPESASMLITSEACKLSPELCENHYLAYAITLSEVRDYNLIEKIIASTPKNFLDSPRMEEVSRNFVGVRNKPEIEQAPVSEESSELRRARQLLDQGHAFFREKNYDQAIEKLDELIGKFSDSENLLLLEQAAMAMVNKGSTLGALNRAEEAIQVYDQVVELYKKRQEPQIVEQVARAMVGKGKILSGLARLGEAEMAFLEAIELNPTFREAHICLLELLLNIPGRQDEALRKAKEIIAADPQNAGILNATAWFFYACRASFALEKAREWAQDAVAIKPGESVYQHTLACVLAALGEKDALEPAAQYIQDTALVEQSIEDAIQLFVELAAAGYAKEALALLTNTPAAKHLEPLVAGLRLFLGEKLTLAVEIMEIAKDIVKKIEAVG